MLRYGLRAFDYSRLNRVGMKGGSEKSSFVPDKFDGMCLGDFFNASDARRVGPM